MSYLQPVSGPLPHNKPSRLTYTPPPVRFNGQAHPVNGQGGKRYASLVDGLAVFGNIAMLIGAVLRLGSPLISRKAVPLSQLLMRGLSTVRKTPVPPEKVRSLSAFLANRESFNKELNRFFMFGAFFQGLNGYQTAVNTRQPSLIANAILRDLIALTGIIYPRNVIFSFWPLVLVLYSAGKLRDIDNSNHPERRQDFDFRRLTRFLSRRPLSDEQKMPSFRQELNHFGHFIGNDLRNAFSLKSWQTLKQTYRDRKAWETPQPYQAALGAQASGASWIATILGMALKRPALTWAGSSLFFMGTVLLFIPLYLRAWQNRADWDGKLVLFGMPLEIAGNLFMPQYTKNLVHLNGLEGIGGTMVVRGLTLNSRHYRAFVDLLDALQAQAAQNPKLTAGVILQAFQSNPNTLKHLQKRMGESRVVYLSNLLQRAEQARLMHGTTLAAFLTSQQAPEQ